MSDKLAAALEAAKITRIVLIRHANAAPPDGSKPKKGEIPIHDWQRDDQVRSETETALGYDCLGSEEDKENE
eukprot:3144980-Rhodomonas_salina.2